MNKLKSFADFLNESINEAATESTSKVINISFDAGGKIGKVNDKLTISMSPDSTGLFKIGKDVEKFCGIPEADVKKDVAAGKDKPEDAIIYGMSNIMNGGKDIYLWTNGTRLGGVASKDGNWSAILEQISFLGVVAARLILVRAIAKNKKVSTDNEDWITYNYGDGEYMWPAVGDLSDKNPLIQIEESSLSTALGAVLKAITPGFLEMSKNYISDLKI
jgi:hypothetical protein